MDRIHEHKRVQGIQGRGLPFFYLREDAVRDLADHLGRHFNSIQVLDLVMDIPCAHAPCVKGDYFFFDAGNIPLVFGNKLWLKLPVAVPGDIKRELSKLAFDSFLRIPIAFVVCVQPSLVVLL